MTIDASATAPDGCPGDNTLAALVHGTTGVDAALSEHLSRCETCQALLAELLRDEADQESRYAVLELVGVGGMGLVVRARDTLLERDVALKVLRCSESGEAIDGVLSEARALARVEHPNIVTIYDAGTLPRLGTPFIAMELVRGSTLRTWLEQPRRWAEVRDVFVETGRGLAAAHAAGVVHADFKPSNVLMPDRGGHARVTDFGLARRPSLDASPRIGGTPRYMAPEQRRGEVTPKVDQYAFGVALHEALLGRHPHRTDRCPTPGVVGSVPRWLQRIVARCLEDDPDARHPSMDDVVRAMARTRIARVGVGLLGVGLVAGPFAVWASSDDCEREAEKHRARWDDTLRPALAQGMDEVDWSRVRPSVELWVDAWIEMHTDACRTQAVPAVHRCLQGRWATLDALGHDLTPGDPKHRRAAPLAVLALPSARACADASGGDHGADSQVLTDCVLAIAQGRAKLLLGDFEGAQQQLEEAVALARTHHLPGMQARAELALAKALWQRARPDAAFEAFSRAAEHAIAADLPDVGATALAESARFVAMSRQDMTLARSTLRQARAFRSQTPSTALNLDRVEAWILHQDGDSPAAIALMQHVIERTDATVDGPSIAQATNREDVAVMFDRAGDSDRALQQLALALEARVALLGPQHPSVARTHSIRASVLQGLDRLEEAALALDDVVKALRASFGPDAENVALASLQRAHILLELDRLEDAAASLETPQRVYLGGASTDAVRASLTRQVTAQLALKQGEPQRARLALRELLEEHQPPLSPQREALARRDLGLAALALGEPDEAATQLRRALEGDAIRDPITRGETSFAIAQALSASERCSVQARDAANEALDALGRATSTRAASKAAAVSSWLEDCSITSPG